MNRFLKLRLSKENLFYFLFFVLAISFVIFPFRSGYVYSGSDMHFHLNRIYELKESLVNLKYPWANFLTFNKVGYPINSFYPNLTLVLVIPFYILIHNPIVAYYTSLVFIIWLTEIITYKSAKAISHKINNSFLAAVFYVSSGYMTFVYWFAFELGEILSFMVLPIIVSSIVAFYKPKTVSKKLNQYRWKLLAFSLIWITNSHVLMALITNVMVLISLLVLLISDSQKFKSRINEYFKVAGVYILGSLYVLVSMFTQYVGRGVVGPDRYFGAMSFKNLIINSLDNIISPGDVPAHLVLNMGIVMIVVMMVCFMDFHNLGMFGKTFFWLGVLFTVASTDLFPWDPIVKIIPQIQILQFSFRFLIYSVLFLLFSFIFTSEKSLKSSLLIFACVMSINLNKMYNFNQSGQNQQPLTEKATYKNRLLYSKFRIDNHGFIEMINSYHEIGGPKDYLSTIQKYHAQEIFKHDVLSNNHKIKSNSKFDINQANYKITLNHDGNLDLPVLLDNFKYRVTIDDFLMKYHKSSRGTIQVDQVDSGKHNIKIIVQPHWYTLLSLVVSLIIILLLLVNVIRITLI
ncbi:hypothetical protein [Limosilactobacillus equigenerosi]|nr:hypothetical protein [Limosilactobacillus equigenerosi]